MTAEDSADLVVPDRLGRSGGWRARRTRSGKHPGLGDRGGLYKRRPGYQRSRGQINGDGGPWDEATPEPPRRRNKVHTKSPMHN